jgi:hypothetical protein
MADDSDHEEGEVEEGELPEEPGEAGTDVRQTCWNVTSTALC